ncbi:MAG: hypothetical protein QHH07_04675, partial [Sedimentisphaerales bacterium]|nr:hypothetical protein [Sedimentisphaerales bacterium]
ANIAQVITRFVDFVMARTGTSSISVNRNVRHLPEPVVLHSECTHTMISQQDYERFLLEYDIRWASRYKAFGVHYCGPDPHRHIQAYAKIPGLYFMDVGAGGDVRLIRRHLPHTFLNVRLDPVKLRDQTPEQIRQHILDLAKASGKPSLTGICCINMDQTVSDQQITAILQTATELRQSCQLQEAN